MFRRLRSTAAMPLILLALVSIASLGARVAWIGGPCQAPCNTASDHTLVFDEAYYVNAARVIAGISPPAGSHYAGDPSGTDPNAEHPQGAKLIMAGSIELFGDGPLAWRLGSLVFGTLAILGMFVFVRAAGGSRWQALAASTLMACDNLLLVHGRIGTLDIYVVAAMVWGVALYVRGSPILAGIVLAVGACFKLVAPYALAVLVLIEVLRLLTARGARPRPASWGVKAALVRCAACTFTAAGVFVGLLAIMDQIATPYADNTGTLITGGPFAHLAHMFSYAANQTSPHGPMGIASYPWQWLVDYKPITYLQVTSPLPGHLANAIGPPVHFLGMISPPIMLLAVPSLVFAAVMLVLARRRAGGASPVPEPAAELPILGLAWFLGTFVPFEALSILWSRTSYLYYMVIVMPGIYASITYMLSRAWGRKLTAIPALLWALGVVAAIVIMYPFSPLY
jgi:hypothetical protein